mmetsp:Transcript_4072/g.6024  ORF Transcript_4072/g.6024 Transcript_4072/m.6024 type:complete len:328 (-) Transcript_4072:70-1053(-)
MPSEAAYKKGTICFSACNIILCCLASSIFIIGAIVGICILIGVNSVYYTKFGVRYDVFTTTVDKSRLYEPGVHLIGWGGQFIEFPRILETISFDSEEGSSAGPVTARTYDGLSVSIELSFQYSLPRENVNQFFSMFDKFADKYEDLIIAIARDNVRDTSSNYTAISFFENRTAIGLAMESSLSSEFSSIFINLEFFQLRAVSLPPNYESILQAKEISRTRITTSQVTQLSETVKANTKVFVASTLRNATVASAIGRSSRLKSLSVAASQSISLKGSAFLSSYDALKTQSGFNNSFVLKSYFLHSIQDSHDSSLFVQMDKPVIVSLSP